MKNNFFAYALALFDLNKNPTKVFKELNDWYSVNKQFPSLTKFLIKCSSKINQKKLVAELFKTLNLSSSFLHWLWVVIDDSQYANFNLIYKECKKRFCALTNTVDVHITSAFKLSNAQEQQIMNKLKTIISSNVSFEIEVDTSLIGGLKISYQNNTYDNTIKNKLFFLKNKLLETKENQ